MAPYNLTNDHPYRFGWISLSVCLSSPSTYPPVMTKAEEEQTTAEPTKKEKIECYVDEEGDKMNPNNIFRCVKPAECCHEEGVPTCCTKKTLAVGAWEQFVLWGTLAGLILVLALVMWHCRHDGDCCGNQKGERGCLCCKRKDQPDEIPDGDEAL